MFAQLLEYVFLVLYVLYMFRTSYHLFLKYLKSKQLMGCLMSDELNLPKTASPQSFDRIEVFKAIFLSWLICTCFRIFGKSRLLLCLKLLNALFTVTFYYECLC